MKKKILTILFAKLLFVTTNNYATDCNQIQTPAAKNIEKKDHSKLTKFIEKYIPQKNESFQSQRSKQLKKTMEALKKEMPEKDMVVLNNFYGNETEQEPETFKNCFLKTIKNLTSPTALSYAALVYISLMIRETVSSGEIRAILHEVGIIYKIKTGYDLIYILSWLIPFLG
jgi:cytochrome c553